MNKILVIFLSIVFTGLVLQSCGAKNRKTADPSKSEANEEEIIGQQSESEFQYELVPLRYKNRPDKLFPQEWNDSWLLAVKQDGKFVAFDNDADYSGLAKESQLYCCIRRSNDFFHLSDEDKKTIAHLVPQYLRDKSRIREHELFIYIDKAYYNGSDYISGDYYLNKMSYHHHTYTNGVLMSVGLPITFECMTPSESILESKLQTLDGEIVPEYALVLDVM